MIKNKGFIVELIIAVIVVIWLMSHRSLIVPTKVRDIDQTIAIDPNITKVQRELDDLLWQVGAQQSMAEQIEHMSKEIEK